MRAAIEEFGGFVQTCHGDGLCAYFGVQSVLANDSERAAHAALRILELVAEYAHDIELAWGFAGFAVRVGINSGRAAVGSVLSADPQAVALSDATNVAARLQEAAELGTILVADTVARRLTPKFAFEPLGEIAVKGREAPVPVSRLTAPSPNEAPSSVPASLGREHEIGLLRSVVADVVAGRGRVVVLSGAAGIGKTRLLAELRPLAGEHVMWLEGHCPSYGGVAPWPFIEILLDWLTAEAGEPEIAVRTKARARLGALLGERVDEVLAPLSPLLRLRPEPAVAAQEAGEIPMAYLRWLEALAAERPVVIVVEDIQWADAPTRALAEAVMDLTDRAGVALVLTDEPVTASEGAALRLRAVREFAHRTTEISLGPLVEEASAELLAGLLGDDVEPSVRIRLVREAEGNPLYLDGARSRRFRRARSSPAAARGRSRCGRPSCCRRPSRTF